MSESAAHSTATGALVGETLFVRDPLCAKPVTVGERLPLEFVPLVLDLCHEVIITSLDFSEVSLDLDDLDRVGFDRAIVPKVCRDAVRLRLVVGVERRRPSDRMTIVVAAIPHRVCDVSGHVSVLSL